MAATRTSGHWKPGTKLPGRNGLVAVMNGRPKLASDKVAKADRATYDRCAVAMLGGQISSWSIDRRSGVWLVQLPGDPDCTWDADGRLVSDTWRTFTRDQVAELLDGLGVAGAVVPTTAVRAPRPVAPKVATPAPVAAAVREILSAPSAGTSWSEPVAAYLARLIHPPKRAYAVAMVAHLVDGAARPADPGTDWAEKVRVKLARLVPAGVELLAVAS